jgi:hypothetical protein
MVLSQADYDRVPLGTWIENFHGIRSERQAITWKTVMDMTGGDDMKFLLIPLLFLAGCSTAPKTAVKQTVTGELPPLAVNPPDQDPHRIVSVTRIQNPPNRLNLIWFYLGRTR